MAVRIYGRTVLIGGSSSVDNIASGGLSDGDICIVIDSVGDLYFYRYNASSSVNEESPYYIKPDDIGAGNGRWILSSGAYFGLVDTSAGYITLLEDKDNSTEGNRLFYKLQAPAAIGANQTFTVGRQRTAAYILVGTDVQLSTDDTNTVFYSVISGLTTNVAFILPTATGSGVHYTFVIATSNATYYMRVRPAATDSIVARSADVTGTPGGGKSIGAHNSFERVTVVDIASNVWVVTEIAGTWSYQ